MNSQVIEGSTATSSIGRISDVYSTGSWFEFGDRNIKFSDSDFTQSLMANAEIKAYIIPRQFSTQFFII